MAKRNDETPFGEEYQKIIEQNRRRKELGVDETGERIKRPAKVVPNKGGDFAKRKSTETRKRTASKKTARQEALMRKIKPVKLIGGMIPASPKR